MAYKGTRAKAGIKAGDSMAVQRQKWVDYNVEKAAGADTQVAMRLDSKKATEAREQMPGKDGGGSKVMRPKSGEDKTGVGVAEVKKPSFSQLNRFHDIVMERYPNTYKALIENKSDYKTFDMLYNPVSRLYGNIRAGKTSLPLLEKAFKEMNAIRNASQIGEG